MNIQDLLQLIPCIFIFALISSIHVTGFTIRSNVISISSVVNSHNQRLRFSMTTENHFDYLVIGGGSGGVATARRAAGYGVKVGLIEKSAMVISNLSI